MHLFAWYKLPWVKLLGTNLVYILTEYCWHSILVEQDQRGISSTIRFQLALLWWWSGRILVLSLPVPAWVILRICCSTISEFVCIELNICHDINVYIVLFYRSCLVAAVRVDCCINFKKYVHEAIAQHVHVTSPPTSTQLPHLLYDFTLPGFYTSQNVYTWISPKSWSDLI